MHTFNGYDWNHTFDFRFKVGTASILLSLLTTFVLTHRVDADELADVAAPLELWLDARHTQVDGDGRVAEFEEGERLASWTDRSSIARSFTQKNLQRRPTIHQSGKSRFVRFDGVDDCMRFLGPERDLKSVTIFMVAAIHDNPGDYCGLFSANQRDRRDYETGFNIDLGPAPTERFEQLNIEGRGFGGAQNLRRGPSEFGSLHLIEVLIDSETGTVSLSIDGKQEGTRPYAGPSVSLQDLTLGARHYTNGPGHQTVRGYGACDLAEVLVFSGGLSQSESTTVREQLLAKHNDLAESIPGLIPARFRPGIPLVKPQDPEPIEMLVPGFEVTELPVSLPNINNVRYCDDGKLVTLGYNGDVHLLSDSDGDGLEDRATVFYHNKGSLRGPIGMTLTPPDYEKGRGLFVPSKGKVSLIVDTNHDDVADDEIVVAEGWEEIPQNVDAVGSALDTEGNLYFGLGAANYANAYLIGEDGKAKYSLKSERGTVQKVAADFSSRETIATGLRFPIAFAFNSLGDLFCTEQEGATWLANGNPFDELLHLRQDRHYGFPPRHPRHNPDVIDEPSTFDYGPQHQSTCGMVFNQLQGSDKIFGPDWWRGDAIVCGESRGKIWRTKLVRTDTGYVAATQLLACLQMLTVDACVTPNGDLVVACHSGPPDWGTGPTGIGKLYRIRMVERETARPIACWTSSPQEIQVAFDRPLDPLWLRDLKQRIRVQYGENVRAGDRFENLSPPYAVVRRQRTMPRRELPISGVSVSGDLTTLIVQTSPMPTDATFSLALGDAPVDSRGATKKRAKTRFDLDFGHHGVLVEWTPAQDSEVPPWSGWIPHLDLAVSKQLLAESLFHEALWSRLEQSGELRLRTRLDLRDVLRPRVQKGEVLDHEWPKELATLRIISRQSIVAKTAPEHTVQAKNLNGQFVSSIAAQPDSAEPLPVEVRLATGLERDVLLRCSVSTNEDPRDRPLPLRRFWMPWRETFDEDASSEDAIPSRIVELEGGSWGRGHQLFHGPLLGCSKCHTGDPQNAIGPDLSNLVHRDYASVMRDIVDPSFAINPDHLGHVVALNDGRVLTGVLRSDAGRLVLGDSEGRSLELAEDEIERMEPAKVSVMPKGLLERIGPEPVRDLMTYLLSSPPQMPLDSPLQAPPVRTTEEVVAALSGADLPAGKPRLLNLVLVDGEKDHGPGEHDYPAWRLSWEQLFLADPNVRVSTAREFPDDEQLEDADVLVFFQKGSFGSHREKKLDAYLNRGGGAAYIHWAVNGNERATDFARRIGLASHGGRIRYRHGPVSLAVHNRNHPIVRNFQSLQLYDESYWKLSGDPSEITLLATSMEDGAPTPQIWVTEKKGGRVFVSIPGHYSWTFDDPLFRILLLRGIAWTAHEPVDRFNALVTPGARISR